MPDTVFRTPVAHTEETVAPEQNPDVPHSNGKTEVPIALYQELKGMPYSAEYFDVKEIWDSDKLSLKEDLEAIDEFYRRKIGTEEYKDGKDAFEKIIKEAIQATGAENDSEPIKIMKVAEWVKFWNRIKEIGKYSKM